MAHLATPEFEHLFKNFPLYSQEGSKDPIVIARLFDAYGSAVWYLTEYNPEEKIAFGYVTGLGQNEFGYTSIVELESIYLGNSKTPRIERDLYFTQCCLSRAKTSG